VFGYKQKGLDMKEFNEQILIFDEKMDNLNELSNISFNNIKVVIFKKKCNLIEDYISSLPDDVKEKIKNVDL